TTVLRVQGAAGISSVIANVSDPDNAPGSLIVSVTNVPAGISISGITNAGGTVSATVGVSCLAPGAYSIGLDVSDGILSATATLMVNVTTGTDTDGDGVTDACVSCPMKPKPEKVAFVSGRDDG